MRGIRSIGVLLAGLATILLDGQSNFPAAAQTSAADASSQSESLPPEPPSESHAAEQAELRKTALRMGLIYKNDAFWAPFKGHDTRKIFEQYGEWMSIGGVPEGAILMRYLAVNSQKCRSSISNPYSFKLDEITTRSNGWGQSSQSRSNIYDMVVPGRFAPLLRERFNQSGNGNSTISAMQTVLNLVEPGQVERLSRKLAEDSKLIAASVADVDRLMALGPCGNPIHRQFEDMLFHKTKGGVDPGKVTRLRFSNAAALSDRLYRPGDAKSFRDMCVIAGGYRGYGNLGVRVCECVAPKVAQVKPEMISTYTRSWSTYRRDRSLAEERSLRGEENPDNRLYSIMQYCAGGNRS